MKDLFELLREQVGCEYISDLCQPQYKRIGRQKMSVLPIEEYPLSVLADMAEYLYGERPDFADQVQAKRFFVTQNMKAGNLL